ncbi:MAG: DUF4843 domain-containing protein [Dysgonamonadaceae bacterium]|jgi:hypothetical protein|nr:DUF4843 domain-containing protein [Dysgonamonadaceae bacterium]
MKNKILSIILTALAATAFYSCEYETLPSYSADDQIYFSYADERVPTYIVDSSFVRFGYDIVVKADTIVWIEVKVQGKMTDYDRPVNFGLIAEQTTAQLGRDVELLPEISLVPAGSVLGKIYLKLKNTAALDNNMFVAAIELKENEYFKTDFVETSNATINKKGTINSTHFRIYFDNANEAPNFWVTSPYDGYLNLMFGRYSKKKFAILCDLFGFDREYFSYDISLSSDAISALFNSRFTSVLSTGWSRIFKLYLEDYRQTHGEPLYEDDGTEMTGGTSN